MIPPCAVCEENPFDLWRQFDGLDISSLKVLNLGSGKFDSLISKQLLDMPFAELWNVEVFGPYIEAARRLEYSAKFVHFNNAKIEVYVGAPFRFDVVLLLDVLEHFDKPTALFVWMRSNVLATQRVLCWIPVGECKQDEYDHNPYQKHLSTWELDELLALVGQSGRVEYFPAVHKHFNPPVAGAWVIWEPESADQTS